MLIARHRLLSFRLKFFGVLTSFLIINPSCYAANQQGHGGGNSIHSSHSTTNYSNRSTNYSNHGYNNNHAYNNTNHSYPNNNAYHNHNHYYPNNHYYQNGYAVGFPFAGFVDESDFSPDVTPAGPDDYDYSSEQATQPSEEPEAPPQQSWVSAGNGQVPQGAVVNTDDQSTNGPVYYCQAVYNNQTFSGVLVPNDGCYVQDEANSATIRLTTYEVLVEMQ
jgi:hypothetical protein